MSHYSLKESQRLKIVTGKTSHCTMCTLYSFFSSRPSEVRLILKSPKCCTIQHKFVPARSVERNIEKIRFPWASNSKFVIFSQIFPRSNYKICPIIPRLFPISNGDSPVSTTFPRSNYRGFLTTGESYCTMYTLCIVIKKSDTLLSPSDDRNDHPFGSIASSDSLRDGCTKRNS